MMPLQQGDIVLIPFPFSNLLEDKLRPVFVISNKRLNSTKDFIGLAISRRVPSSLMAIPLVHEELEQGIMVEESFIYPHKINLLEQTLIHKVVAVTKSSFCKKVIKSFEEYLK